MDLMKKIDVTYLPQYNFKDSMLLMDDINLKELEEAYLYTLGLGGRSFCTYPFLIKSIPSPYDLPIKLSSVIDFPYLGESPTEMKLFEAGQCFELCKKATAGELDIVLNLNTKKAERDIFAFTRANINNKIGIKYIFELGTRSWEDLSYLLNIVDKTNCKYVKTNTGRRDQIPFNVKCEYVKKLRDMTTLPIKVSGGIKTPEQCGEYLKILGPDTIFGVSYSTLKEW